MRTPTAEAISDNYDMIITTKKEEEGGHIVVLGVDDDAFAEDQLRPGFDHI